jgi:serine/threonine-protein kinase PknK
MSGDAPRHSVLAHARYEARDVLGEGAQGVVLRVVDREEPERPLVAKVWKASARDEGALAGEFALLARLRVRGLVRAHDFGRDERTGAPFFVEDFVGGPDAREWIHAARGVEAGARLGRLLADVAATLAALHDAGFVHGDLKPAHVRVVGEGQEARATLLDLGSAVMRGGEASGFTPAFAAPELLAGSRATGASDLYSLGATAWAAATGRPPPEARARKRLREEAPWVRPGVADAIEALLAEHPNDRPSGALDVLARVGAMHEGEAFAAPPPIGREDAMRELLGPSRSGVRYVTGPSGAGKSHLVREVGVRALLGGRDARVVTFPSPDAALVAKLVAYLRGADHAWPFVARTDRGNALVVLDDLQAAPREVTEALDAWRCRPKTGARPEIVATARSAPDGAEAVDLGPLADDAFARLCRALGIEDEREAAEAARASDRNPGWLVASCRRVPLTRDTVLERVRERSPEAREALATIALCGGTAPARARDERGVAELLAASLVTRRGRADGTADYSMVAPSLAAEVAAALATYATADRTAAALLEDADAEPASLLAVAQGPVPPSSRDELLERAASGARARGLRSEEIDSLFALAARADRRDGALLRRLEKLTRDAGTTPAHPQVLSWLEEAAARDPSLRPLVLRRKAERAAREGNAEAARALAAEARDAARIVADATSEALAVGTAGAIALWRGDWNAADAALSEARARLASCDPLADPEELARLEHNAGVVALYRGRVLDAIDAFERSLERKRALGDRAGVRSCLLNLGIALTKATRWDDALRALDEALALAVSLRQKAGRAWCLAARADVDVRRGMPVEAERWIAEAEALGDDVAPVVTADLALLRAQVALLQGDGRSALAALARIPDAVRAEQALVDARARVLQARARLAMLPADARQASRLAIAAIRRARAAALPEVERDAIDALHEARRPRSYAPEVTPGPGGSDDSSVWAWLDSVGAGCDAEDAALALCQLIVERSGAERAFVVCVGAAGNVERAWGCDLDGLALAEAERRIDADLVRAAISREDPVHQRDVPTAGGRGARIAASAAGRVVVIAEHRFQVGRFDAMTHDDVRRWSTLAAVLARLLRAPAHAPALAAVPALAPVPALLATTALPISEPRRRFSTLLGSSPALRRALAKLDAAIDGDLPVLLVGETGAGKELFARALHDHGARARGPFVAVNCGAIPDTLFESELFGHARGSFTNAERARGGLLARAEGGTLLLDEIGELPIARQATLLRALETRRYRAVGSDDERPFDVRIVAATNRNLVQAVEEETFRRDLLYRLNVVEIRVPPLRERAEDVPLLARAFLERAGCAAEVAPDAMAALATYAWPGNVRELEHVMQRLAASGASVVRVDHLPRAVRAAAPRPLPRRAPSGVNDERVEVERALSRTGGNISQAARVLGLSRQGLKKRMARLGMREGRSS